MMSPGFPAGTPMHRRPQWAYYDVASCSSCARRTRRRRWLALAARAAWRARRCPPLVARARAGRLHVAAHARAGVGLLVAFVAIAGAVRAAAGHRQRDRPAAGLRRRSRRRGPRPPPTPAAPPRATTASWCSRASCSAATAGAAPYSSVAPALTRRPLLIREVVRYASPLCGPAPGRGRRPGPAGALGARPARSAAPAHGRRAGDPGRRRQAPANGALDPVRCSAALQGQGGFQRPRPPTGCGARSRPSPGRGGERGDGARPAPLRRAARRAAPGSCASTPPAGPPCSRATPKAWPTWPPSAASTLDRALFYAGSLNAGPGRPACRGEAPSCPSPTPTGARQIISSRLTEDTGPTLTANEPLGEVWPQLRPVPGAGLGRAHGRRYSGLSALYSPAHARLHAVPPVPALRGRGRQPEHVLDRRHPAPARPLPLPRARATRCDVDHIDLTPHADGLGQTRSVAISVNGGPELPIALNAGPNRIPVRAAPLRSLRVRILRVTGFSFLSGQGGIDDLHIPGLRVRESLRLPTELATRARGLDLATTRSRSCCSARWPTSPTARAGRSRTPKSRTRSTWSTPSRA